MNYMSLCSGVEAISVAWKGLGFNPVAFSEIEKFPSAVLDYYYPNVPNYGDMLNYKEWKNDGTVGLIVGGTPCQSFSIAGLRRGLEDPRGNLMLTFGAIIKKYRPTWLLWENVPGVLSSNRGRDFGTFLGMLGQLGYGYAYRILDAQHFGVAQRRRRVFVVGYLGDWRNPAKVLFEQESLRGDTQKGKKERQGTAENSCNGSGASSEGLEIPKLAPTLTGIGAGLSRPGNQWQEDSWYIPTVAGSLDTECGGNKLTHQSIENGHILPEKAPTLCATLSKQVTNQMLNNADAFFHIVPEKATTLRARDYKGINLHGENIVPCKIGTLTTRSTTSTGARDVEDGYIIPVYSIHDQATRHSGKRGSKNDGKGNGLGVSDDNKSYTLTSGDKHAVAYSFDSLSSNSMKSSNPHSGVREVEKSRTLDTTLPTPDKNQGGIGIVEKLKVRRLTPIEAERLQGFEDDYTRIPYRGKPKEQCPDGPRYKAMGNSMAVPVVRWIGERIKMVNDDV